MKVRIEIEMDGAAFEDDGARSMPELARIVRALGERLEQCGARAAVPLDANGNSVGRIWFKQDGREVQGVS